MACAQAKGLSQVVVDCDAGLHSHKAEGPCEGLAAVTVSACFEGASSLVIHKCGSLADWRSLPGGEFDIVTPVCWGLCLQFVQYMGPTKKINQLKCLNSISESVQYNAACSEDLKLGDRTGDKRKTRPARRTQIPDQMGDKLGDKTGDKRKTRPARPTQHHSQGRHTKTALRTPTVNCLGN